jgi:hypothetical protein
MQSMWLKRKVLWVLSLLLLLSFLSLAEYSVLQIQFEADIWEKIYHSGYYLGCWGPDLAQAAGAGGILIRVGEVLVAAVVALEASVAVDSVAVALEEAGNKIYISRIDILKKEPLMESSFFNYISEVEVLIQLLFLPGYRYLPKYVRNIRKQ